MTHPNIASGQPPILYPDPWTFNTRSCGTGHDVQTTKSPNIGSWRFHKGDRFSWTNFVTVSWTVCTRAAKNISTILAYIKFSPCHRQLKLKSLAPDEKRFAEMPPTEVRSHWTCQHLMPGLLVVNELQLNST